MRISFSSAALVGIALLTAVGAGCGDNPEPARSPTPQRPQTPLNSAPAATQTQSPTSTATATDATPEPTSTAAPTPPSRPQVTPTREPAATATPTPPSQSGQASDRGGVWAGRVERPGPATHWFPWVALRVTPGENPDVDAWRLEGGPVSLHVFECRPQRQADGWQLGDCEGAQATAFVPLEGESGLEIELQHDNGASDTITLARLSQREEPKTSANVSLLLAKVCRMSWSTRDLTCGF